MQIRCFASQVRFMIPVEYGHSPSNGLADKLIGSIIDTV